MGSLLEIRFEVTTGCSRESFLDGLFQGQAPFLLQPPAPSSLPARVLQPLFSFVPAALDHWTLPSQTIDASSEANSCSVHQGLVEVAEDRRDAPARGMLMSNMGEHDEVDGEEEEGGGGEQGEGP